MATRRAALRIALPAAVALALLAWVLVGWRLLLPPYVTALPGARTEDMVFCSAGMRVAVGPVSATAVAAFWIDRFEVTRHDYALFLANNPAGADAQRGLVPAALEMQPDLPVTRVSLAEARNFAAQRGKRLPSSIQWEWAAAGPGNLPFPWGEAEAVTTLANTLDAGFGALVPVGMFEGGRSRFGAYDLVGNAAEWTDSTAGAHTPDRFLVKGGSYLDLAGDRRTHMTALDSWVPNGAEWAPISWRLAGADAWFSDTGFRCVLDEEAAALDAHVRSLLQQLGSHDPWGWFFERRGAEADLRAIGAVALPYLDYAVAHAEPAHGARLDALAQSIRRGER